MDLQITCSAGEFYPDRPSAGRLNSHGHLRESAYAVIPHDGTAASSSAAVNSLFQSHQFNGSSGLTLPYRLLTPPVLVVQQSYPLVLFLHGSGERGDCNELQLRHGVSRFAEPAERRAHPSFVLAPQCPRRIGGSAGSWITPERRGNSSRFPEKLGPALSTVMELVALAEESYPVDPARIYVVGISMGGFATWQLLHTGPERFAAGIPICGGGNTEWAASFAHRPVWVFHGDQDSMVPVEWSREMVSALREAGASPRYTEYPGVGHNSWDRAFSEPDLLHWLFLQSK